MNSATIGFIGGGNMTRAIAGGLLDSGYDADQLLIAEPAATVREQLAALLPGVRIESDNNVVAATADCVVLAVKPQVLGAVCRDLAGAVQRKRPLLISIAAGIRSDDIETWLGGGLAIVRVMPNQPALLRRGVSGLYANDKVTSSGRQHAEQILLAVGQVAWVDSDADIDAVTAVSGSGPAYFFLLIDALQQTATELGLSSDTAKRLALETARGAAELAAVASESEGLSMEQLIDRVRSPGGTTAAALACLDNADARAIFARAITAARDRAIELADEAHQQD